MGTLRGNVSVRGEGTPQPEGACSALRRSGRSKSGSVMYFGRQSSLQDLKSHRPSGGNEEVSCRSTWGWGGVRQDEAGEERGGHPAADPRGPGMGRVVPWGGADPSCGQRARPSLPWAPRAPVGHGGRKDRPGGRLRAQTTVPTLASSRPSAHPERLPPPPPSQPCPPHTGH